MIVQFLFDITQWRHVYCTVYLRYGEGVHDRCRRPRFQNMVINAFRFLHTFPNIPMNKSARVQAKRAASRSTGRRSHCTYRRGHEAVR